MQTAPLPVDSLSPSNSDKSSSAAGVTSGESATYFPLLDWLRFVLACIVMLSHYGALASWPPAGTFAVHVFFALSGWLIGGILLDAKAADLPRFYFNRSVRIWAPYYLALTFLLIASVLHDKTAFSPKWLEFVGYKATFVWNLFGTQQLATFSDAMPLKGTGNHFWSVNAEEQFYLLAPLLLVLCVPRIGRNLVTWLLIAAAAYLTGTYASIIFGIVAVLLNRRLPHFHHPLFSQIGLAATVVLCACLFVLNVGMGLVAPWCAIAIVLLLARPGRPSRIGSVAGGLSYQLYLNHWIGGFVATVLLIPLGLRDSAAQTPLAIVVSLLLGYTLYRFIDRPLLAARKQLFVRVPATAAMWAGYGIVSVGILFGLVMTRL